MVLLRHYTSILTSMPVFFCEVLRYSEGFAGHDGIQCIERRASDDREISARSRGGSLRANAQWQGAVPRRPYVRCVTNHDEAFRWDAALIKTFHVSEVLRKIPE